MIYLIDDRKHRQEEGGWSSTKFSEYSEYITPIYNYLELSNLLNEIYSSGNIVLFHESFIDKSSRANDSLIKDFETMLKNEVKKDDNFKLVYFSGSKKFRNLKDEIGYLPVEIVYQNLAVFIKKIEEGIIDLKYLLYGNNHQIEETLYKQLRLKNDTIEDFQVDDDTTVNFVAKSLDEEIDDPFTNAVNEIIFGDEISDEYLNEIIIEWFSENEYDNLFIPLCFGPTLSDYNGLRLAVHIRCTDTKNQLKPIFIYSFVDYSFLIENEYFDILKTKNIFLIEYSKKGFKDALDRNISHLQTEEISNVIKKINLQIPSNYEDSHSIANEWAIYRWSRTIDANDDNIEEITAIQNSNLYFKYLKTIYPISHLDKLDSKVLKINFEGHPKVLYIDDEANKGWREIFYKIFLDDNDGIDFIHLDDEFNEKSKEEIIDISIKKTIEEDIDLVILDFRLHKDDFGNGSIGEVTGFQILKEIKKHNKGIQVIIFSATNKIWNLQALQEAGADGFIIKESPENSVDPQFTKLSIENLIHTINKCFNRNFLKDFYSKLEILKAELIPRKNYNKSKEPLPKEFVDETLKWLELSNNLLSLDTSPSGLTASFLFYFSVIENMANRVIDIDNLILIGVENGQNKYNFQFRIKNQFLRNFIEVPSKSGNYHKTNGKLKSTRNMPWIFKILNTIDFISDEKITENELNSIIKKRNDIIHANATTGDVIKIDKKMVISLYNYIFNGLKTIK